MEFFITGLLILIIISNCIILTNTTKNENTRDNSYLIQVSYVYSGKQISLNDIVQWETLDEKHIKDYEKLMKDSMPGVKQCQILSITKLDN